jgi:hypothetical protein
MLWPTQEAYCIVKFAKLESYFRASSHSLLDRQEAQHSTVMKTRDETFFKGCEESMISFLLLHLCQNS